MPYPGLPLQPPRQGCLRPYFISEKLGFVYCLHGTVPHWHPKVLPPFDTVSFMLGPCLALTFDTAVGGLSTAGALLHLRIGQFLLTSITLYFFCFLVSPFLALLLFGETIGLMFFASLFSTDLAAVEFGITILAFDGEPNDFTAGPILLALDLLAFGIAARFSESLA